METLIIVRHGLYNDKLRLTPKGLEKLEILAAQIQLQILDKNIVLLTSPAPRAKDSAEVLARQLGVTCSEHGELWSDADHPQDNKALFALIQNYFEIAEVLILVTHLEYAQDFPRFFGATFLDTYFPHIEVEKGEAVIIYCDQKTYSVLA